MRITWKKVGIFWVGSVKPSIEPDYKYRIVSYTPLSKHSLLFKPLLVHIETDEQIALPGMFTDLKEVKLACEHHLSHKLLTLQNKKKKGHW